MSRNIQIGDVTRVCLPGERLWAKVMSIVGNAPEYVVLENQPFINAHFKFGEQVRVREGQFEELEVFEPADKVAEGWRRVAAIRAGMQNEERTEERTEDNPLSIDFQSFGSGETPRVQATVVAESHEDYEALRKEFEDEEKDNE